MVGIGSSVGFTRFREEACVEAVHMPIYREKLFVSPDNQCAL